MKRAWIVHNLLMHNTRTAPFIRERPSKNSTKRCEGAKMKYEAYTVPHCLDNVYSIVYFFLFIFASLRLRAFALNFILKLAINTSSS